MDSRSVQLEVASSNPVLVSSEKYCYYENCMAPFSKWIYLVSSGKVDSIYNNYYHGQSQDFKNSKEELEALPIW